MSVSQEAYDRIPENTEEIPSPKLILKVDPLLQKEEVQIYASS